MRTQLRNGLLTVAAVVATVGVAAAQTDGGRFESRVWGIRIAAPEGWRISTQASYPHVLVWMYRATDTGKMLLAAERLSESYSSVQYAKQTVTELAALGYRVATEPQIHAATPASWIEFDDGRTFFRQAFLIDGGVVYSLTLAAPDRNTRSRHLRAFDAVLRSMQHIEDAAEAAVNGPTGDAEEPADGAGAAGGDGAASPPEETPTPPEDSDLPLCDTE